MDNDLKKLEAYLEYSFSNIGLLNQALRHPSYTNENPESGDSNQRMEFIGDALLGSFIALELYKTHPGHSEGHLTGMRSRIVSGKALANVARDLKLDQQLLLGQGAKAGAANKTDSTLAAVLEAVIGAVFLDNGYEVARRVTLNIFKTELLSLANRSNIKDLKSELQELLHALGKDGPKYQLINTKGPDHQRTFTIAVIVNGAILGEGHGGRKLEAEEQAAQQAIANLTK
ncbi:MAG: ribonuclease-3 [Chloroflexi bacterium]|jgi:ribonuclease-3|nr:MAG: ribonuclease-3 [Chloroflexota bacterium]